MTTPITPIEEPVALVRFEEPLIEFGYGQTTADPRDGLTLFGPLSNRPREVRVIDERIASDHRPVLAVLAITGR